MPTRARWRQGGEGLGGAVRSGELRAADDSGPLAAGEWSRPLPLESVLPGDGTHDSYFTLTAGPSGKDRREPAATNVSFEIEQLYAGETVRRLQSVCQDGGTLTLFVPGVQTTGFVHQLATTAEVARARNEFLSSTAGGPLPKRFAIVSDLGGYGAGSGYGRVRA